MLTGSFAWEVFSIQYTLRNLLFAFNTMNLLNFISPGFRVQIWTCTGKNFIYFRLTL